MKETEIRLLVELLKNSKKSDRELAKNLGISQATVTRTRNKLEQEGLIQQFTVIPNLPKLGYEILAISSFSSTNDREKVRRAVEWTKSRPEIMFAARAEGNGKNGVVISIHKNYTEFSRFLTDLRFEGISGENHDVLLVSLKGLIVKPLHLGDLGKLIEKSLEHELPLNTKNKHKPNLAPPSHRQR